MDTSPSKQNKEQRYPLGDHSSGGIILRPTRLQVTNESEKNSWTAQYDVVIVKGQKSLLNDHRYSFPKGHIEGETALVAAYREIYEEAGIKQEQLQYVSDIGVIQLRNGRNRDIHFFLFLFKESEQQQQSQSASSGKQELPEAEFMESVDKAIVEVKWVNFASLLDTKNEKCRLKEETYQFFLSKMDVIQRLLNK